MLDTRRKLALVLLPITLFLLTAGAIAWVSTSYGDPSLIWTADAAILTGAALIAALVGLPIALYQLFAVERDLGRLAVIPPGHFSQLHNSLEASRLTLDSQTVLSFGKRSEHAQLWREAFFAHFPELSPDFAMWDQAVERVQSARAAFAEGIERTADELGVAPDIYDREAILRALKELTRPSLHFQLEEWPENVPVRGSVDGSVEIAGIRTNVRLAGPRSMLSEEELRSLVQPLADLCDAARRLPAVQELARAQDALTELIQPLADKLALYLATETFPVSASCPICKVNIGG